MGAEKKFVAVRRRNQHARRARSPDYAVALPSSDAPNWIPCASGNSLEKLIVFVCSRVAKHCWRSLRNLKLRLERGSIWNSPLQTPVGRNAAGAFSSGGAAFKRASNVFTLACAGEVKSVKLAA